MTKLSVIDLFCGAGGLSYGLELAGFDIVLGVDNDKDSISTFTANHKNSIGANIDMFADDYLIQINQLTKGKKIDVVVGGPPCQGFSLTGTRDFDDRRNTLYLRMFGIVKHFKPEAFIIENVPGMATLYSGQVKEEIISRFTKLGYEVNNQILIAANYGVPQLRRRLVFVGVKKKYGKFEFPEPTHNSTNYVSTSDAISDLPSRVSEVGLDIDKYDKKPLTEYQKAMRKNSNTLYNHVAAVHTQKVIDVIKLVPEGGNYKDLPVGIGEHRNFHEAWTRYHSKKPSKTIDTGHRNHFHYKWNRVPTVRENARLQSFPDTFRFLGTKTSQFRQVGNAVPPLLAKNLGLKLLEKLCKTEN